MAIPAPSVSDLHVGLGEAFAAETGRICVHGLGSCVAVALWCARPRVGMLCHVVLPDSCLGTAQNGPARFADRAVPFALDVLRRRYGVPAPQVVVKLAGGAVLFASLGGSLAVGPRNVEAVEAALAGAGLRPAAQDTGGKLGRSVRLDVDTGLMTVRRFGGEVETL